MDHNPTKHNYISTSELAKIYGVKPNTIRRNLCVQGHFLGIRPIKLPNRHLRWPNVRPDELEELVNN